MKKIFSRDGRLRYVGVLFFTGIIYKNPQYLPGEATAGFGVRIRESAFS